MGDLTFTDSDWNNLLNNDGPTELEPLGQLASTNTLQQDAFNAAESLNKPYEDENEDAYTAYDDDDAQPSESIAAEQQNLLPFNLDDIDPTQLMMPLQDIDAKPTVDTYSIVDVKPLIINHAASGKKRGRKQQHLSATQSHKYELVPASVKKTKKYQSRRMSNREAVRLNRLKKKEFEEVQKIEMDNLRTTNDVLLHEVDQVTRERDGIRDMYDDQVAQNEALRKQIADFDEGVYDEISDDHIAFVNQQAVITSLNAEIDRKNTVIASKDSQISRLRGLYQFRKQFTNDECDIDAER